MIGYEWVCYSYQSMSQCLAMSNNIGNLEHTKGVFYNGVEG